MRPSWVLKGARFDLDFANNRYFGGHIWRGASFTANGRAPSLMTGGSAVATADTMFCPDANGIYRTFPQGGLRITPGRGLWVESTTTNYALHCRNFTNAAWSLTSMTASLTGVVGADNSTGVASRLTATGAGATALQSITLASGQRVSSVLLKRNTGTGTVEITQDNSNWTDVTSQINSTGYTLVHLPAQTITNPVVGIRLGTSGDVIDVDFWQTENALYPTTRILTTTTTRSRAGGGSDMPSFGTTGSSYNDGERLINTVQYNTPQAVFAIYSGNGVNDHLVKGGGNTATNRLYGGADGGAGHFNDAATSNTGTSAGANAAAGLGAVNKIMGKCNGFGSYVCLNGGDIGSGTVKIEDPDTDDHIGVGNNGGGTLALNGYISRLTIWTMDVPSGLMRHLTTPGTVGGL